MILQQSLAQLLNSHWHDCSTVTGTLVQQSLARFFNSHWHDSSTATGIILQQSLARFFNSGWHDSSTVAVKIFSVLYAGRILQHWCSLLKNRVMYQKYDTWSQCLIYWYISIDIYQFQLWSIKCLIEFIEGYPVAGMSTCFLQFYLFTSFLNY